MIYKFEFQGYQKQFKQPLNTSHGTWKVREGIIIKLTDETGKIGYGEIAPIPWFGSETLQEAKAFCQKLGDRTTDTTILGIPNNLPACQFAFESAIEQTHTSEKNRIYPSQIARLLPAGISALSTWENLYTSGYRTFKWKIAVANLAEELDIFQKLVSITPTDTKLRLDANGGLNYQEAVNWLEISQGTQVEFLEQPLSIGEFEVMQQLAENYETAIALDESVATITQLQECHNRGWQGAFVIKPAIAGYPSKLRQFIQKHQIDAVFSSAFETSIGRQAALKLARELSNPQRALGFGVDSWWD